MTASAAATRSRPRSKPGTKVPLTRDRILDAALVIVDRDGLDALTMRSLGLELGVEAMSLYRHLPNKADLLEGVVDRILAEMKIRITGPDWRAAWRRTGRAFWRVLQAHPNAIPLLLISPTNGPNARRLSEEAMALFATAGFPPVDGHRAFRIFQGLILGIALMYQARPTEVDLAEQRLELEGKGEEFPLLRQALASKNILDRDSDFDVGLDWLIGGWTEKRR